MTCVFFFKHLSEFSPKFSLHLSMAQDCMDIFEKEKLADLASVEQV